MTDDDFALLDEFLAAIDAAGVQVLLWFCPIKEHGQGTLRPTVEWRGGVGYCTYYNCGRSSADPKGA
jgi:hypothetical protein